MTDYSPKINDSIEIPNGFSFIIVIYIRIHCREITREILILSQSSMGFVVKVVTEVT